MGSCRRLGERRSRSHRTERRRSVPVRRLRRRAANSMPSRPTSAPTSSVPWNGSPNQRPGGDVERLRIGAGHEARTLREQGCPRASSLVDAAEQDEGQLGVERRCCSGMWSRTTRRAKFSISSRTPRRSWTCCSPSWNGDSAWFQPSDIDLIPAFFLMEAARQSGAPRWERLKLPGLWRDRPSENRPRFGRHG